MVVVNSGIVSNGRQLLTWSITNTGSRGKSRRKKKEVLRGSKKRENTRAVDGWMGRRVSPHLRRNFWLFFFFFAACVCCGGACVSSVGRSCRCRFGFVVDDDDDDALAVLSPGGSGKKISLFLCVMC